MSRAARLRRLEELLLTTSEGHTIGELAKRLGVHYTTIWRDLNELSREAPVQQNGRCYWIDRIDYLSNVRLSGGESLMLYLAMRRMIRQTSHAPPMMVSALAKLTLALQHPLAKQLAETIEVIQDARLTDPARSQVWETLIRAWLEQITVRITYQKFYSPEPSHYEVQPYLFEPAVLSEGVYLIGHSRTHGALRTFKVERIVGATLTTERFVRPDEIDVDTLLQHAWGIWYGEEITEVRLRFRDAAVARRVRETVWHPSQEIHELPDGGVEWVLKVAGVIELVPWIRGWGPDCEVLEPPELRKMIAQDMRRAAGLYEEG